MIANLREIRSAALGTSTNPRNRLRMNPTVIWVNYRANPSRRTIRRSVPGTLGSNPVTKLRMNPTVIWVNYRTNPTVIWVR